MYIHIKIYVYYTIVVETDELRAADLGDRCARWRPPIINSSWTAVTSPTPAPSHGCYVTDDKPVPLTKFESIYTALSVRPTHCERESRPATLPVRKRVALADFLLFFFPRFFFFFVLFFCKYTHLWMARCRVRSSSSYTLFGRHLYRRSSNNRYYLTFFRVTSIYTRGMGRRVEKEKKSRASHFNITHTHIHTYNCVRTGKLHRSHCFLKIRIDIVTMDVYYKVLSIFTEQTYFELKILKRRLIIRWLGTMTGIYNGLFEVGDKDPIKNSS